MCSQQTEISQNMSMESSSSEEDENGYETNKDVINQQREDESFIEKHCNRETSYGSDIRERKNTSDYRKRRSRSKDAKKIQELEERLEKSRSADAKTIKKLEKRNSCNFCQIIGILLAAIAFTAVIVALNEDIDTVKNGNSQLIPTLEEQDTQPKLTPEEQELDMQMKKVEKEILLAKHIEERNALQKNVSYAPTGVQDKLQTLLESIKVNKNDKNEYEVMLKDQLVEYWKEESKCKLMKGIHPDKYQNFLDRFEKSLGSSKDAKEIIETLKDIVDMDEVHNMVKIFNMEGTDVTGRYGMIAVHKNENGKIDVAYAVYSVDAKFVGGANNKQNNYKIYKAEEVKDSGGLFRLGAPVVEDVTTGKMVRPDQRFKQDDVSKLAHNFIVAKALMAFQQNGIIQNVNYSSEQIEMDQTEKIENKSSN